MIEQCDSKSHLHQISITGLPEGYRAVEFKIDPKSCIHIGDDGNKYITAKLQLEKIQPRRIVLEKTDTDNFITGGVYYVQNVGGVVLWNEPKIWRLVEGE